MAFSTDLVKVVVKSGESDWVYLKQGETVVVLGTCEGKDEAMASRGVIFQSVAGRESGVTVLVVSFAIFISTRPDLRDFLTSIRSVQNYNRFLVYLTIYRSIEI